MITCKIIHAPARKLVGMRIRTTLSEYNATRALWQRFKANLKTISNRMPNTGYYSVQDYENLDYFKAFNPATPFYKWAAVEVTTFENIPPEMEILFIESGLYAVFIHRGTPATFAQTAQYIYGQWLPSGDYVLNNGPHFEIMDEQYNPANPEAEEEVWVPIKVKEQP